MELFIVMPEFNSKNGQIYLKWVLGEMVSFNRITCFLRALADRDCILGMIILIGFKGTGYGKFMLKSVSWLITCLKQVIRDLLR
jgi:hypothetical protein